MIELTIAMLALVGGLCLLFAAMAAISDYLIPAVAAKPWRAKRRVAARYVRRGGMFGGQ